MEPDWQPGLLRWLSALGINPLVRQWPHGEEPPEYDVRNEDDWEALWHREHAVVFQQFRALAACTNLFRVIPVVLEARVVDWDDDPQAMMLEQWNNALFHNRVVREALVACKAQPHEPHNMILFVVRWCALGLSHYPQHVYHSVLIFFHAPSDTMLLFDPDNKRLRGLNTDRLVTGVRSLDLPGPRIHPQVRPRQVLDTIVDHRSLQEVFQDRRPTVWYPDKRCSSALILLFAAAWARFAPTTPRAATILSDHLHWFASGLSDDDHRRMRNRLFAWQLLVAQNAQEENWAMCLSLLGLKAPSVALCHAHEPMQPDSLCLNHPMDGWLVCPEHHRRMVRPDPSTASLPTEYLEYCRPNR